MIFPPHLLFLCFRSSIHFRLLYLHVKLKKKIPKCNDDYKFVPKLKSLQHIIFLNRSNLQLSHDFRYTSLHIYSWDNLKSATRCMYHCTHILSITFTTTHNNTQIQSTHTYTHIHTRKKSYSDSNVNIFWLYFFDFFDFSKIFLSLLDDSRKKTEWKQWLLISQHAIRHIYI